jgi:hypothetical protein
VVSLYTLWVRGRRDGRAHFTAAWDSRQEILITNHGPGLAENVVAKIDSLHPELSTLEMPAMGALQAGRIAVHRGFNSPPLGPVVVTWKDNRWRAQRAEIHLGAAPMLETPRPAAPLGPNASLEDRVKTIVKAEVDRMAAQAARRLR